VEFSGVTTGEDGQPHHRVLVDPDQAARLADAAALLEMPEDGEGFLLGEFAAVQRGTLTLRETLLAGAAGEDPALLVGSIAEADPQVVEAALTVIGAITVLAAEDFQVVHEASPWSEARGKVDEPLEPA
jgi:hypothetical protein